MANKQVRLNDNEIIFLEYMRGTSIFTYSTIRNTILSAIEDKSKSIELLKTFHVREEFQQDLSTLERFEKAWEEYYTEKWNR